MIFYTFFRLKEKVFDDVNKSKLSRVIFRSSKLADEQSGDVKRVKFSRARDEVMNKSRRASFEEVAKTSGGGTETPTLEMGGVGVQEEEEEEDEEPAIPDERLWLAVPEGHLALSRIPTLGPSPPSLPRPLSSPPTDDRTEADSSSSVPQPSSTRTPQQVEGSLTSSTTS